MPVQSRLRERERKSAWRRTRELSSAFPGRALLCVVVLLPPSYPFSHPHLGMEKLPLVPGVSAVFIAGPGMWCLLLEVSGEHSAVTHGLQAGSYFIFSAGKGPRSREQRSGASPTDGGSARAGRELEKQPGALCRPDCSSACCLGGAVLIGHGNCHRYPFIQFVH